MKIQVLLAISIALLAVFGCTDDQEAQQVKSTPTQTINLINDESYDLDAQIVSKEINGNTIQMYGYNGQIPGPILKVKQGSNITVTFKNSIDMPTTVHWHGIRLENKYDGVPDITQKAVLPGQSFTYKLRFPDSGIYWYHPHIREDIQQEMGLYGAILVEPNFSPATYEEVIFLDDILLGKEGQPLEFYRDSANFALMGRFGNVMLTNGKTDYTLNATAGQPIRLYLINSANSRVFNFKIEGASLKVIGGDSGPYEEEFIASSIILGPSERAIVDVTFNHSGSYEIQNSIPEGTYHLGSVKVTGDAKEIHSLVNHTIISNIVREQFNRSVDLKWRIGVRLGDEGMMGERMISHTMDLGEDGIEWEDSMVMMNAMSDSKNTKWFIRDESTGKENMDIMYKFKVGDIRKIRIYNDPKSPHPMQHPIHIHGQRFLVLSTDGIPNKNLVWKDTVLIPTGKTVDILVDFENPGDWMFHCHIAEHLETGMMGLIQVEK